MFVGSFYMYGCPNFYLIKLKFDIIFQSWKSLLINSLKSDLYVFNLCIPLD